jgi:ATP-binding cassette subfamily F protein uup
LAERTKSVIASSASNQKVEAVSSAAEQRQLKKDLARVERQVAKEKERLSQLKSALEAAAFNPDELIKITTEISGVESELAAREEEWLEITLALEN